MEPPQIETMSWSFPVVESAPVEQATQQTTQGEAEESSNMKDTYSKLATLLSPVDPNPPAFGEGNGIAQHASVLEPGVPGEMLSYQPEAMEQAANQPNPVELDSSTVPGEHQAYFAFAQLEAPDVTAQSPREMPAVQLPVECVPPQNEAQVYGMPAVSESVPQPPQEPSTIHQAYVEPMQAQLGTTEPAGVEAMAQQPSVMEVADPGYYSTTHHVIDPSSTGQPEGFESGVATHYGVMEMAVPVAQPVDVSAPGDNEVVVIEMENDGDESAQQQ